MVTKMTRRPSRLGQNRWLLLLVCPCLLAFAETCGTGRSATAAEQPAGNPAQQDVRAHGLSNTLATTQLFGIKATGSKFVYVLDRSRSMGFHEGQPLRAAKLELVASLNDLDTVHQFQIVFYNERPSVLNPFRPRPPRILFATEQNKGLASDSVQSLVPAGGTNHEAALRLALGMQPDVVFLLTDADEPPLTASEIEGIRKRNAATAIHVVEFGSGPVAGRNDFLARLAKQNNGQYLYIDVSGVNAFKTEDR